MIFALDEALKMMREEGLDNIFFRHNKHKLAMSNAVKALNLKLIMKDLVLFLKIFDSCIKVNSIYLQKHNESQIKLIENKKYTYCH